MNTVQYGDWKIAVDKEKTRLYYSNYRRTNSQANRNFEEYCKSLSKEEREFFDSFGISPECCEIEHMGVGRKGNFPCGGYYYVCGEYSAYPKEELMSIDELAENDFADDRDDPRINIGIFQFDFQCEHYEFNDIPEDIPEGFICIRFWCEEMKWLLSEKPEEFMYEPPRFWEIHKIIKEKIENKKQSALDLKEKEAEFLRTFNDLGINAVPLSKRKIKEYKEEWVKAYLPLDADSKEIKMLCLNSRKYTPFLWHIFSYEFLDCEKEEAAIRLFEQEAKEACVIVSNVDDIAYRLDSGEKLTAEALDGFIDITVTAENFGWTYTKTHEEMYGPYFYTK